jgi:hypothetical protein
MTDAERKEYDRLAAVRKEEEEEEIKLKEIEDEKKAEEEKKRLALKNGDPVAAKKADEKIGTLTASESSVHALLEELARTQAMLEMNMKEKGIPDEKINEVKRRKFLRVTSERS